MFAQHFDDEIALNYLIRNNNDKEEYSKVEPCRKNSVGDPVKMKFACVLIRWALFEVVSVSIAASIERR